MSTSKQWRTGVLLGLCAVGVMGGYAQANIAIRTDYIDMGNGAIHNLKAGEKDTDGVNVSQLKKVEQKAEEAKKEAKKNGVHYFSVKGDEQSSGSNYNNDGAKKDGAIAIGQKAKGSGYETLAIGTETAASGYGDVAIGYQSKAHAPSHAGIAIGYQASVNKNQTIAIGAMASTTGENGIALGTLSKAQTQSSIAVGANANVATSGSRGIAIGNGAYVGPKTDKNPGDAWVPGAEWKPQKPFDPVDYEDDLIPKDPNQAEENGLAVGMKASAYGFQTTAVGAAAQAHDTNSVAIGVAAIAKGHYSTAVGKQARTYGKETTALGHWADVRAEFGTAVGAGSIVYSVKSLAVGTGTRAYDANSVALGADAIAKEAVDGAAAFSGEEVKAAAGIVSVGNPHYKVGDKEVAANYRRVVNVAGGIRNNDAVNVAQLKAVAEMPLHFYAGGKKAGNDYTVGTTQWTMSPSDFHLDFGEGLKAEQITKDGKTYTLVSIDKKSAVTDITVHAEKKNDADTNNKFIVTPDKPEMTVKGDGKNITATIEQDNTVKVALKDDITVNSVKIGKNDKDAKTYIDKDGIHANGNKVTNVAAGELSATSTDAVNGAQLFATNETVAANTKRITNLNETVNKLGGDIVGVRNESRETGAMNAALAALKPLDFDPLQRSQVMAGVSTYRGKQAVALGLAHYSNEDTLVHGGVSYAGHSELMANLGISWRFGDKDDRDNRKARAQRMPQYAAGPMSSVYVLQDEVAALKAKNDAAEARIAALEEQVRMLLARE